MPDFASSAKFRQKVKNMLCLLNYNKNFVSTIDKAWIMKAIIIVIVLMIVIWGHWLFYYHSNSIQPRALRDWAERGRSLLTNVSITHGQQREAELHSYTLRENGYKPEGSLAETCCGTSVKIYLNYTWEEVGVIQWSCWRPPLLTEGGKTAHCKKEIQPNLIIRTFLKRIIIISKIQLLV